MTHRAARRVCPVEDQGKALHGSLEASSLEDVIVAVRHFEDLEVFVGQRSRMHPGPGWDVVLTILRRDLEMVRSELRRRQASIGQSEVSS